MVQGDGFLAIWSDVAAAQETDYLHWLTREHMAERLGVPGFLAARVWRAQQPGPARPDMARFMILYDLADAAVVASPAYLARLDAPTPWTRRIMPVLRNFARGGGRCIASAGAGQGGAVAAWRFADSLPADAALVARLAAADRIAAVHLLETDREKTSIRTQEKHLRANDAGFAGMLLVEALDADAIRAAAGAALSQLPEFYAPVFALQGRSFDVARNPAGARTGQSAGPGP